MTETSRSRGRSRSHCATRRNRLPFRVRVAAASRMSFESGGFRLGAGCAPRIRSLRSRGSPSPGSALSAQMSGSVSECASQLSSNATRNFTAMHQVCSIGQSRLQLVHMDFCFPTKQDRSTRSAKHHESVSAFGSSSQTHSFEPHPVTTYDFALQPHL